MALPHPPLLALQATGLPGCRCRAPFYGCICPLVLDTESWEEEGGSFCLATRKGSRCPVGRVGTGKEDPSLVGCFILVPSSSLPSPPSSESPLVPLIVPADVTPHSGHSHALPCNARDTSSYPLACAPILLPKGGLKPHCPVCCHEAPSAISQGRAKCPLYMRLHDGSDGALLRPQTLN